jgi:polysaccharide biosynthesis/export protein VpsN
VKKKFYCLILSVALCFTVVTEPVAAQNAGDYLLGAGDLISIRVFGEEELSFDQVRLSDGGAFSFPFIGEIVANGRSAADIEAIISDGLRGDYLIDPKVSVRIIEFREFFVNGEVNKPGGYEFAPGMTVRKAVARAGGFTEWAAKSKVMIIRERDPSGEPVAVDLDAPLMPGDIITVNQGLF